MSFRAPPELARYKLDAIFDENTVTHHPSNRQPPPGMESATTVWGSDKVLGSGTFGTVWLQKEKQTGTLRAVKIISKSQSDTQELKTLVNLHDVCRLPTLCFLQTADTDHSVRIISYNSSPGSRTQIRSTSRWSTFHTAICPSTSPRIRNGRRRRPKPLRNKF